MKVFIAFNYTKGSVTGFSNAVVSGKPEVPSEEDLLKIKQHIKYFGQYDDVVIINYIRLSDGGK
jgi:hypothetical protein